jgi:hypothetical protein
MYYIYISIRTSTLSEYKALKLEVFGPNRGGDPAGDQNARPKSNYKHNQ